MVEQAGSLAGFAAIVGLAVLSALYFSQARDLRRLREWAGRAPERAAEGQPGAMPGRVVAVPQRPAQPVPHPSPGPAPAAAAAAAPDPANGAAAEAEKEKEQAAQGEEKKEEQGAPAVAASNGDSAPSVAAGAGNAANVEQPAAADDEAGAEEQAAAEDGSKPQQPAAAPAKPGMPAPASAAAAAAGAGAASLAGPAVAKAAGAQAPPAAGAPSAAKAPGGAPPRPGGLPPAGGPPRPGAGPQRPPGSVLPPRTGTMPPVRRLPSSTVGPAQTGVLGAAPQEQPRKRNPVYIVLAVVGVLVVGAAAAIGVPALVNGTKDNNNNNTSSSTAATKSTTTTAQSTPAVAPNKITVAVLNGTSIPGLAAQVGDRVDAEGFTLGTVSNASPSQGQRANSVAMYSPGHERDASRVAKKLGIHSVERADANSRQIAGDASVVVVVGSDKTQ